MLRLLGVSRASAWAAAGAGAYSLGQFANYVFVAKTCPVEDLGRFALAFAWVTPVMLAARMQLRYVIAADAGGELPLGLAARARALTAVGALVCISATALTVAAPETAWAVVLAALIRASEDAGDLLLGVAQRAEAWPAIARSLALRGLGGAGVFGLSLAAGSALIGGMAMLLAWQTAVTILHDWPAARPHAGSIVAAPWRDAFRTVQMHAALGGAAALVSLNTYVPRYALERFVSLEAVGVYTALAQLALIGNMAVQAIGQAAVAPLGRRFQTDPRAFRRRVAGLVAFAAASGAVGLAISYIGGARVLALFYRPEYAAHADAFVWLMAAAAFTYVTAVLGYALVAAGERQAQLRIFGLSTAVAVGASLVATPVLGMRGAAIALLAAWVVAAAGAAFALARRLRACPRPEASPKLKPWLDANSARPGVAP